jgi:hypothetical protein
MKLTLFSRMHTMIGLLGALLVGPALLMAAPVRAAGTAPTSSAQGRATVPTNNPAIFAFPTPPAGFDPTTASAADLQRYGFPLPPSSDTQSTQYQHWLDVVRHATHEVVPTFTSRPGVKHAMSPNWSGAVSSGSTPCGRLCIFSYPTEVRGGWTVPSVASSTQTSFSSTWVGLDGVGNNQVEQMGTEQQIQHICFAGVICDYYLNYYAWFELFPDSEQVIDGFPIGPGQIVWADVHYYASDNTLSFWLEDLTTGQYAVFATAAKYGCACATAEWITERPQIDGSYTHLADFVHTHISDAYFRTAPSGTMYAAMTPAFSPFTVNMVNGSGTALAYGYAPALDEVDSSWVNYS